MKKNQQFLIDARSGRELTIYIVRVYPYSMTRESAFRKLKHDIDTGAVKDGSALPPRYTFEEIAFLFYEGIIYSTGTQFRVATDITGDFSKAELHRGSLFPRTEPGGSM